MSFPPLPSATQIQTALRHKSEIEHHRNKIRLRAKRRGHYEFPVVDDLSSGDTRERHRVYRRAQMQIDKILDPTASVPSVFIEPRKRCALRAGLPEVCLWRPCSPAPAWAAPITRLPLHLPQNLVPGFTLPPLIQLVENGSHPFFLRWSSLVSLLRLPSLPVPSPPRHGQVHFFSHSCPQSLGLLVFQTPSLRRHAFSLITAHIYALLCSIPVMALVACHVERVFLYQAGPCLSILAASHHPTV